MDIESWFILLPIILWPFTGVFLAKYGRKIGSLTTSFYRQFTIFLIWIPILFFDIWSNYMKFLDHWWYIFLASITGFVYIMTNFLSSNLLPYSIVRIFYDSSRMLFWLFIGYFLLWETITFFDMGAIILLFIGFYLFSLTKIDTHHLKTQNIPLGITLSVVNWILFTLSIYYFKLYADAFSPITAAYILEVVNGVLIAIFLLWLLVIKKQNYFQIWKKEGSIFLILAPLSLLASYWLAVSYEKVSFYVINLLFILQFLVSVFFSSILLKEKLSYSQIFPTILVIFALTIIVLY